MKTLALQASVSKTEVEQDSARSKQKSSMEIALMSRLIISLIGRFGFFTSIIKLIKKWSEIHLLKTFTLEIGKESRVTIQSRMCPAI